MSAIPLILLWMFNRQGGGGGTPMAPMWPSAASPPPGAPNIPAFQPLAPPMDATANTGTPLADLLKQAPAPPPADRPLAPAKPKAKPKAKKPASAAARVLQAAKARGLRAAQGKLTASTNVPLPPQKVVSVLQVQTILNARGTKLVKDGLYGPKTANAWMAMAKKKGLPPLIQRAGPKIAKVVPQTFDTLSVPGIP